MAGLSAGLVAVVGVGGTLAYLSAQSDVVENSFTVGKGFIPGPGSDSAILLDEVKVDPETGKPVENGKRVLENEYNNLLPGDVRVKDPTVHLGGGSVAVSYTHLPCSYCGFWKRFMTGLIFRRRQSSFGNL